ncbi:MAG TPA: glycosyltransferase [Candidatus Moranbacteria bacterium]|nr:glycosyltransferase [Candidatus Moranbacteria bacterium]
MKKHQISVVVPVYNNIKYTTQFLVSIYKNTKIPFELIIVNNGSTDGTKEFLEHFDCKVINKKENVGFVKAVNEGMKKASGEYLVGFNNDIVVGPRWLEKLVNAANSDGRIGIVGMIFNGGGSFQNLGKYPFQGKVIPEQNEVDNINHQLESMYDGKVIEEKHSIPFSLALIKRKVLKKIAYLSEEYGIGLGDDGDFNIRARAAGFRLAIAKDGYFYHHGRTTFKILFPDQEILDMQNTNMDILKRKYPEEYKRVDDQPEREFKKADKSKLNILLTNNHLFGLGGSETYLYAMAKELHKRGHNIEIFTLNPGPVAARMEEFATTVTTEPKAEYDLILINHKTCLERLKNTTGFKVFTSHGIYPELEQPEIGANAYVGISEEVVDHIIKKSFKAKLIRNGIDCHRFSPTKQINKNLVSVLSLCQREEATKKLKEACEFLGLQFNSVPTDREKRVWNIEELINNADLVVGLGRGAYEAMACGRAVIIYDERSYDSIQGADGIVIPDNADEVAKNNFSGRRFKKKFTVHNLIAEMEKYDPVMGEFNRKYALENFNIEKQVDKYLELYANN